jgi:hypothetical protein
MDLNLYNSINEKLRIALNCIKEDCLSKEEKEEVNEEIKTYKKELEEILKKTKVEKMKIEIILKDNITKYKGTIEKETNNAIKIRISKNETIILNKNHIKETKNI